MITYRLWDELEAITSGDIRLQGNTLWQATANMAASGEGELGFLPSFSPNWRKSTDTKYIEVRDVDHFLEVKINSSADDITFILPNPAKKDTRDVHISLDTAGNSLTVETHDGGTLINKNTTSMEFNTSADSIVYHPSSATNWQVRSEVADMPPLVFACGAATSQTFAGSRVDVLLDTDIMDKGGIAHLETGEVVFDKAGIFNINVSYGADITSNNRSTSRAFLQLDTGSGFGDVTTIVLFGYHRQTNDGEGTSSQTTPLEIAAGDRLKLQVIRNSGTGATETIPNACALNITSSKGLRGEKWEKGDQGFDGADGDITWEGIYASGTYQENQAVEFNGSSFVCTANGTVTNPGTPDTPNTGWDLLARKGADGSGATINVAQDSGLIPSTPHGTLNFTDGVITEDGGSGVANIKIVNVQPYLSGNSPIVLFDNTTSDLFITGEHFDNNITVDLGSAVTINSVVATTPTSLTVNYTTSSTLQSATAISVTRNNILSFGQSLTCTVTDVISGTGVPGTWTEDFNSSEWSTPRWTVTEGSSLTDLFRTGQSTASSGTGATAPYDGDFLYTERSSPNFGSGPTYDAWVDTTDFADLTQIRFQLHMFANTPANLGDLVIYSQNANNSWTERWRQTGNVQAAQADPFSLITLSTTTWDCKGVRIMFEGTTSYESDICLDDVEFTSI